MKVVQLKAK